MFRYQLWHVCGSWGKFTRKLRELSFDERCAKMVVHCRLIESLDSISVFREPLIVCLFLPSQVVGTVLCRDLKLGWDYVQMYPQYLEMVKRVLYFMGKSHSMKWWNWGVEIVPPSPKRLLRSSSIWNIYTSCLLDSFNCHSWWTYIRMLLSFVTCDFLTISPGTENPMSWSWSE